jgi:hypothetical protein
MRLPWGKKEAPYLQFRRGNGAFQDARKLPPGARKVPVNERATIAPIYPGRKLYFDSEGCYLGGSKAYVPPRNKKDHRGMDIEVVELKPGMGLLFGPVGESRAGTNKIDEGSAFIKPIPPDQVGKYRLGIGERLVIVPGK